jgi:hypothetical protein
MTIQKIKSGRVTSIDADVFVAPPGTLFFNENLGDLRLGDGVTPGGILLNFGGGGGGNYTLPTATTSVKGGVKIDGSTITIANQVISVGTVPYNQISGTPTIPTNNNQLTNGAGYITSSALNGYATESYVTGRGYITSSALTGLATETYVTTRGYITNSALSGYALTSAIPTNNNQLTNGAAYITASSLTGLATETYVTTRGYITSAALSGYALTSAIPTDISQLADSQGLLGQGGGGGTVVRNVENPFSFSVAGDDSTLKEISNGESIKFIGAGGVTVTTDVEGNITITGTPVSLVGYATESYVTSQGYITSSALTGLATESYVTSRGYITGLSWNQLTDKPNLAGTYSWSIAGDDSTLREISAGESVKFVGAGGITTSSDDEGKITITGPSLTGYATVTGEETLTNKTLTSPTITNGVFQDTFSIGNQIFYEHGYSGFSVNEDFNIVGDNNFTGYHYTSGAGREGVAFTLARTGQFTTGFGIHGTASNNEYVIGSETTNTDFVFKNNIGMPFNVSGGTEIFRISKTGVLTTGSGESLETIATQSYVTTQGYITSTALTGLATENYVTSRGYITGLSWDQLTNKPNLAGTYSFNVAADDSTLRTISSDETIKFTGAGGITTASDAEGNITITGPSLAGLATETYVTTRGYITSAALTGLATESYVTSRGYITGLSYNDLTDKPNLAGTYTWSIAADDSTLREILANESIKFIGAGNITTASDAEGNITITGAAQDRLTSNSRSAILNSNGTFSLPTLTAAPATPQAGQMALANGVSWDPIAQGNGAPYMVIYTGTAWIGMGGGGGGVTMDEVYMAILELGPTTL